MTFEKNNSLEDEEVISLKVLALIFLISLGLLAFLYFGIFDKSITGSVTGIGTVLHYDITNYFEKRDKLENFDFSDKFDYWATSDGTKKYPESKSEWFLEDKDYHSQPYSLKIKCLEPPCRLHFDKENLKTKVINDPHHPSSPNYLGLPEGTNRVKISYWHKLQMPSFYLIPFPDSSESLIWEAEMFSEDWRQIDKVFNLPGGTTAIGIEMMLHDEGQYLFDDILITPLEN